MTDGLCQPPYCCSHLLSTFRDAYVLCESTHGKVMHATGGTLKPWISTLFYHEVENCASPMLQEMEIVEMEMEI